MSRTGTILLALFLVAAGIVIYVVFFRGDTSFGGGKPPSKPGVVISDHSYKTKQSGKGDVKVDSCCPPLCDTIILAVAKPGTLTYDSIVFFNFLSSGGSNKNADFNFAIMGAATRYKSSNSAGNGTFSVYPTDFIADEDSLRIKCLVSGNISGGSYTFESQAGYNTSIDSLAKTSYSFGNIANGCTKTANSNPFNNPR